VGVGEWKKGAGKRGRARVRGREDLLHETDGIDVTGRHCSYRYDETVCHLLVCSGCSGVFILGAAGMATVSSGGHTTNTFALNYRVCNRLYQIIHT